MERHTVCNRMAQRNEIVRYKHKITKDKEEKKGKRKKERETLNAFNECNRNGVSLCVREFYFILA